MPYKNIEDQKAHQKKYQQTQKYKCYDWKRKGIKLYDEDLIYNKYMNATNCELCNMKMTIGNKAKDRKCLDHDHLSGYFRFICCNTCNKYLQKIDGRKIVVLLEIHRHHQKHTK
tara:strand:+ start:237 stop:578 length:342 start_codon:yes stop_codon:yes gene_type:complete